VTPAVQCLDVDADFVPRAAAQADPLSEVVECLNLSTWIPGRFELTAPWALQMTARWGWFHLILRGSCFLETGGGGKPASAAAGDLLLVFQGDQHNLRDRSVGPPVPIQELLIQPRRGRKSIRHGGGGRRTDVLTGCFRIDGLERTPLHAALPSFIRVQGQRGRPVPYVDHIFCLLEAEVAGEQSADRSVIDRLVRILLIKVLRGHVSELPAQCASWLKALADPDIGRALALMHAQPNAGWTVAALAERVAMSRSAFASRFVELVGRPPMEYLTRWRIEKACALLRTTRAGLKEVATRVGYKSASAFSKAFANAVGVAPGAYRQSVGAALRFWLQE